MIINYGPNIIFWPMFKTMLNCKTQKSDYYEEKLLHPGALHHYFS